MDTAHRRRARRGREVNELAEIVLDDLVIPVGEVHTYRMNLLNGFASALLFGERDSVQPSLTNYGEMRLEVGDPGVQRFIWFATASFWDQSLISNYGTISALLPQSNYVIAIGANSWSPDLFNAGTIEGQQREN